MTEWLENEVIQQLIEEGKITVDDVVKAESNTFLAKERRASVEVIHTLMCGADHDTGECGWYEEERLDNPWSHTFHKLWTAFASNQIKLVPESIGEESASSSD